MSFEILVWVLHNLDLDHLFNLITVQMVLKDKMNVV